MKVTSKQVMQHDAYLISADASELGLPPGQWPRSLEVSDDIGNGLPFVFKGFNHEHGPAVYWQTCGSLILHVAND